MRSRHQNGRVEERGTQVKRWYGHYYVYMRDEVGKESRHHVAVGLGEKSKLRKWEAEERLRKIIANALILIAADTRDCRTYGTFSGYCTFSAPSKLRRFALTQLGRFALKPLDVKFPDLGDCLAMSFCVTVQPKPQLRPVHPAAAHMIARLSDGQWHW